MQSVRATCNCEHVVPSFDNPRFSIIVPVYNAEQYLGECIESIVSQSVGDIEVILVDDGSIDGSSAICDKYARNNRVVKAVHKKNSGPSAARNLGFSMAKGEWVVFVDADDALEPETLAYILEHASNRTDIICFNFSRVSADNKTVLFTGKFPHAELSGAEEFLEYVNCGLLENFTSTKAYRRSFLAPFSPLFDEDVRFLEDIEFTRRVCREARSVAYCNRALYRYRANRSSLCYTPSPSRALEGLAVIRMHLVPLTFSYRRDDCLNNRVISTLFTCYDIAGDGASGESVFARQEIISEIQSVAARTQTVSAVNRLKIALVRYGLYALTRKTIDYLKRAAKQ